MTRGEKFAAKASALIGTRFRAQGRGPGGLDCLGLAIEVFDIPADAARRDYRLRGDHRAEILSGLDRHFRKVRAARIGDLLLFEAAPDQLHFAVLSKDGFIHADAALKRVVETPGAAPWPLAGAFRRRRIAKGN